MKFVVSRGDTNNPEFIGIEIPPSTPGFKHARIFPKGFRFEVTDPKIIQKVREGQFTIEDDGSTKSRMEIKKIEAEVKEEERIRKLEVEKSEAKARDERAKKNAAKEWYEKPRGLIGIGIFIAVMGGIVGFVICEYLTHIFPHFFHSQKP